MPPDDIPSNGADNRLQADPLPLKRGEIGYIEAVDSEPPTDILHTLNLYDLPTRHSVDRNPSPIVSPHAVIIPPAHSEVVTSPSSDQLSSPASIAKPKGMLDFFKQQGPPALGGFRLYTLIILAVQLTLLAGTVTGWVFASKHLSVLAERNNQSSFGYPPTIPVHIVFIIVILIQLVYLERLLCRLRDERYNYLHHGGILPLHRRILRSSVASVFSPWNQPPLPTYAAALLQSGVATGDVEDHIIAGSPPPAYDHTRGSPLVLSGFLQNSPSRESGTGGRGSDVNWDEQRDQVQNAERVRQLEETMARLEAPSAAYIAR